MTIGEAIAPASGRVVRKAAAGNREAAEFVPYSERDAARLARALKAGIAGEVGFSAGDRALCDRRFELPAGADRRGGPAQRCR